MFKNTRHVYIIQCRQRIVFQEWGTDMSYPFVPVVEVEVPKFRQFLPLHPLEMMGTLPKGPQGRWHKPWMVGVAANEALPQALR